MRTRPIPGRGMTSSTIRLHFVARRCTGRVLPPLSSQTGTTQTVLYCLHGCLLADLF